MNADAQAGIDAAMADLRAFGVVAVPPSPPLGWGRDLSCDSDLDPTGKEIDGGDPLSIGQAVVRSWDTPLGTLPDDGGRDVGDYGYSLREQLSRGTTQRDLLAMEAALTHQAERNKRVQSAKVKVTILQGRGVAAITVSAAIVPADPNVATFPLVLEATSSDVVIKAIAGVPGGG